MVVQPHRAIHDVYVLMAYILLPYLLSLFGMMHKKIIAFSFALDGHLLNNDDLLLDLAKLRK